MTDDDVMLFLVRAAQRTCEHNVEPLTPGTFCPACARAAGAVYGAILALGGTR